MEFYLKARIGEHFDNHGRFNWYLKETNFLILTETNYDFYLITELMQFDKDLLNRINNETDFFRFTLDIVFKTKKNTRYNQYYLINNIIKDIYSIWVWFYQESRLDNSHLEQYLNKFLIDTFFDQFQRFVYSNSINKFLHDSDLLIDDLRKHLKDEVNILKPRKFNKVHYVGYHTITSLEI